MPLYCRHCQDGVTFMICYKLSLCTRTYITQNLLFNVEEQKRVLNVFIRNWKEFKKFSQIKNNEMPIFLIYQEILQCTQLVKNFCQNYWNWESTFNLISAYMADGTKLKPAVVFKEKCAKRGISSKNTSVCAAQGLGWEHSVEVWFTKSGDLVNKTFTASEKSWTGA